MGMIEKQGGVLPSTHVDKDKASKQDVAPRERYKSRREDRKPGDEEIETLRTDKIFLKRSESSMAVCTCGLIIDPRLPDQALFSRVSGVCKVLLRKWADVDDSNISVMKISGGITNMLLKAEVEGENEDKLPPVTVRVFGPNTDAVIDRDRELQALTYLSSAGFGAKLLGVFGNGMIQSFIFGRTLEPLDMGKPELAKLIAMEVRRLHELEIPGSKEPQLWNDIYKFIDKASGVIFEDSEKQKTYETISFENIKAEIEELRAISNNFDAPVVFAHNDLLSGNFMYNEDEGKLYIIDYEYGSHSYRGYDIANYFNEHAGFDCDYSLYPDKEKQFYFFRYYLHPENPEMSTIAELEEFYAECNFYSLVSHMYWATWAIVQARYSPIKFDYLGYFFLRFDEYKRRKEELLSLTSEYLNSRKQ
ncbi:probable ethanolamine kinase [Physcomitrium patens]|uniref:ethanolamine kinase n=1 Tax=Physcomitrium patens TaxID=3218 RepID=A9RND2_PHYPA|nr:probable ethanolamine kinase [Physcomitrium patens]XP_024364258.1 probable ethanolamine kinase [Physcomitrium patens]|eukprot:XP_024364257.1 probable ethanolamine kinase [Physcomitrella patens]